MIHDISLVALQRSSTFSSSNFPAVGFAAYREKRKIEIKKKTSKQYIQFIKLKITSLTKSDQYSQLFYRLNEGI